MLKICFTDQRQEPVWVVDKSFTIGGADDNHLVIDDPAVDLQHARILLVNGTYVLHDLGSPAGSYVNGRRITQKTLVNGDIIRCGGVELEVIDPSLPENQPDWCLIACSSWLAGQAFPIRSRSQSNQIKIGRSNHCDMIFPGTHLSREHALLSVSDNCIRVRDLNSANGTFINDIRISDGTIYSGDQLRLDVYAFRVFGPGKRPEHKLNTDDMETLIRRPVTARAPEIFESSSPSPKRWRTRPTSPGNRTEDATQRNPLPTFVKVTAACLAVAVLALIAYVILE